MAVTTVDTVVREDLDKVFLNLDKRDTPFLSWIPRGDNLHNVKLFSWTVGKFDGRMVVGIPENKDADQFETNLQTPIYNRSQKFWRQPMVTTESNDVNATPGDFGKYTSEKLAKIEEQKRDIQQRLLSDADSRDDDSVTGREFMAAGRFINDATSVGVSGAALTFTDTQTAVPTDFRTPTAQIYVGALYVTTSGVVSDLTFGEETLNGMMQNRYDNLGLSTRFTGFVDAALKRHLGRVFRYAKNLTSYTPLSRTMLPPISDGEMLTAGVDMINTDFGAIDINMITWLPRTSAGALSGRGYFLDQTAIALRPSGLYLTHQQLENKGAGPRGLIQSILGVKWGDARAHLKIDPNVINTGT
jgi:hypothetical protein